MDLLHAYSNLSGGSARVRDLFAKARKSARSSASAPALKRARQLQPHEVERLIEHYREHRSVTTAAKAVGVTRQTAGRYLSNAGFVTIRRMSDDDIARAREAHQAGKSVHGIARILGFSPHTVAKALR